MSHASAKKARAGEAPLVRERSGLARLLARGARGVNESERRLIEDVVDELHIALLEGNACLALSEYERKSASERGREIEKILASAELLDDGTSDPTRRGTCETAPLVLDAEKRLYFRRFFEAEKGLARGLAKLFVERSRSEDLEKIALEVLGDGADPRQVSAVAAALGSHLTLIVGGPGTGKTRTVAAILAAEIRLAKEEPPEVLLLAPTGKAATRMKESLLLSMERFGIPDALAARFAASASTIHRALGVIPNGEGRFFKGPKDPLACDLVIVDEASMVDVSLMRHLVAALRPDARLILLGDIHQLASVDVGCVLREVARFVASEADAGSFVELEKSYRFSDASRIARLARAIRSGDSPAVFEVLDEASGGAGARDAEIEYFEIPEGELGANFDALAVRGYAPVFSAKTAEEALARLREYRVLLAHRNGPYGVAPINARIRAALAESGLCPERGEYFPGMPLLVLENDPVTRLSNGDVGVVFSDDRGNLAAFFEGGAEARRVSLAEMPAFEMSFAMTIHKSQGSEYERVSIVLPEENSPLLTRELFYTAVTRAKASVELSASRTSVGVATARTSVRGSGLCDALRRAKIETLSHKT